MYAIEKVRSALLEYFEQKADWRDRVAEKHPEDDRNQRCAAWLRDVAKHIESLGDDDPLLCRLAHMQAGFESPHGDAVNSLETDDGTPAESDQLASRYAFDPWVSPATFFAQWVELRARDCEMYTSLPSEQWDGDTHDSSDLDD